MPKFVVTAAGGGNVRKFIYNTDDSSIVTEGGEAVSLDHLQIPQMEGDWKDATVISPLDPGKKTSSIRKLKIQLGMSCNYSCDYCSQKFVPHADTAARADVAPFLENLASWFDGGNDGQGAGVKIEFWGGEPFVYWKTLKPLAEGLRERYPHAEFYTISNGSLIDDEKIEWLDRLGFSISISHDGPGQHVRGPDPFDNEKQRAALLKLFSTLHPKGRISFNFVLNRQNTSRAAIRDYFVKLTGCEDVQLGEGAFIEAYDEGGYGASLKDDELAGFASKSFSEMASDPALFKNVQIMRMKIGGFLKTIKHGRPLSVVGQKCQMDRQDHIAVDLKGNVLTCQNVSAASVAPNGNAHKIGHVSNLDDVALNTARHWSKREGCKTCPVIHLCGGSCMFLEGELWEASCNSSFADNIPFFAYAFEIITGYRPFKIEGGQKEREKIWELQPVKMAKRVIPIKAV